MAEAPPSTPADLASEGKWDQCLRSGKDKINDSKTVRARTRHIGAVNPSTGAAGLTRARVRLNPYSTPNPAPHASISRVWRAGYAAIKRRARSHYPLELLPMLIDLGADVNARTTAIEVRKATPPPYRRPAALSKPRHGLSRDAKKVNTTRGIPLTAAACVIFSRRMEPSNWQARFTLQP